MTAQPLPRCPPPVSDELLSSWIKRLACANHCAEDELCKYLGLQGGRAPETLAELVGVDLVWFCNLLRLKRKDLAVMLLEDRPSFPFGCIAREDFQHCSQCIAEAPGVSLRHWRFVWSLTCENCGATLVPSLFAENAPHSISAKLKFRAGRGVVFLKSAYDSDSSRNARRAALAIHFVSALDPSLRESALISACQKSRFTLLAAIGMAASRPLLKAALIIGTDRRAAHKLRRAFPFQRRLLSATLKMADVLAERTPRDTPNSQQRKQVRTELPSFPASGRYLEAAQKAIEALGPNAPRHALLSHAAGLLK